ncbi:hypothetical protein PM082_012881 [Marasmius tenuissimus]|nr:hypothetical protein PM082_012881 [Marasmius tenuissimus]
MGTMMKVRRSLGVGVGNLSYVSRSSNCFQQRRHQSSNSESTLSTVQGPLQPALDNRTFTEYFTQVILGKHGNRPGLICRAEKPRAHGGPPSRNLEVSTHLAWDFQEFERHIDSLARGLIGLGVKKGDRVGVVMGNNSSYAMLQWACARIGSILVTINPAYRVEELISTLRIVGVKHLFVVPRIRSSAYLEMLASKLPDLKNSARGEIQDPNLPELRNLVVVDNQDAYRDQLSKLDIKPIIDWREVMLWREDTREKNTVWSIAESLTKDDVVNMQFTSGTTGLPKAVQLTHHNLLNNALSIGRCMRLTDKDIVSTYNLSVYTPCIGQSCCMGSRRFDCLSVRGIRSAFDSRRRCGGEVYGSTRCPDALPGSSF